MIIVADGAFAQQNNTQLLLLQAFTQKTTRIQAPPTRFISPSFYAAGLGIVCKQEIKWDKKLPVNFRFRLGSVEQCNALEGKYRRR